MLLRLVLPDLTYISIPPPPFFIDCLSDISLDAIGVNSCQVHWSGFGSLCQSKNVTQVKIHAYNVSNWLNLRVSLFIHGSATLHILFDSDIHQHGHILQTNAIPPRV